MPARPARIRWRDSGIGLAAVTEIVNLRRARKAKQRVKKEEQADANRALHGTPKAERDLTKARSEKLSRNLDAAKLGSDKPLEN